MAEDLLLTMVNEVLRARQGGPAVATATVVRASGDGGPRLGDKLLVRRDGTRLGSLGGGPLEEAVAAYAREAMARHGAETVHFTPDGRPVPRRSAAEAAGAVAVLVEVHESSPRLVVVGGGHIGRSLCRIGAECGFSVTVIDDRPEYADAERLPEADRVVCGEFEEVLAEEPLDENTYVVLVTRGHRQDEVSLRTVIGRPLAYLGMIGSRRRTGAVLSHLLAEGVAREHVERVRTPIGLDIGAETPAEIAVSIMAEIILERRGGSGRPMREVERPILR